jgi:signal transduction histidine kinase
MVSSADSSPDRIRRLERIIEISRILSSTLDLEPLLQRIVETAAELTCSEASSILLYDEASGELRFEAVPLAQRDDLKAVVVPLDRSIAGTIFNSGRPIVIQDAYTDPRIYRDVDRKIDFDTRSLVGVPLMFKDRVIGVLEAVNKVGDEGYTQDDTDTLLTLAAQAGIAIENVRLLAALQRAYDDLAQLDRMKSNFISIASHELRTPLGLILGHASYLRETAGDDAAEQLDVVVRSALRLKTIIEDLANLSHVEQSRAQPQAGLFGVDEVVLAAVEESQALAQAKQVDLRAKLPGERVTIRADQANLRTVLTNLLDNAVKFTPGGGRIVVAVEPSPDLVYVTVEDTGIGVPADQLGRIFERFYQVESHMTRRHGGLGLGLSIAKALVELQGGRIWCESAEGKGSKFCFTVPRAVATPN